jgi:hypothetical protein
MARIPETFNMGEMKDVDLERLILYVQQLYTDLARAINEKPDLVQRRVDGQVGDVFLSQGTFNINLNTNKVEMLTNHVSATAVTWTTLS